MPQPRTTTYPSKMVLTIRVPGDTVRRLDEMADAAGLSRQQLLAKMLQAVTLMSTDPQLDLFTLLSDRVVELVGEAVENVIATRGLSSGPPTRGAS